MRARPLHKRAGRRPDTKITIAQRNALVAISKFIARKGYPPTLAELAARLDISAPSTLQLLTQLQRKRIISRAAGLARAIRILKKGRDIVDSGNRPR